MPPLHPISVQHPFQIFGVDIMELTTTENSRFSRLFDKVANGFSCTRPKGHQLVAEEVVPMFGVTESLLSDHGANLLANVMMDVCSLLEINKLNTTAYHPQYNGMVECMNHTLKAMLGKHAVKFGQVLTWCFVGLSQCPT